MAWIILIISAIFEAVWATALGQSEGFSQLIPSIVFLAFLVLSMFGLERASRAIPIATAYAVWVGLGGALTVAWAIISGTQEFSWWTVLFVVGIIAAVIGLKFTNSKTSDLPHAKG